MTIEIIYCTEWDYTPQATSLAAAIKVAKGIDATLTPGHKGIFDVIADGTTIYSKHNTGRFPEHDEVLSQL